MLTSWTDTALASHFGLVEVAAVGLSGLSFFALFAFANGIGTSVLSLTSALRESAPKARVMEAFCVAVILAAILAPVMVLVSLWALPSLVQILSEDTRVQEALLVYLPPLIVSLLFYYGNAGIRGLMLAYKRPDVTMQVSLSMQLVNFLLSLAFAFGLGPFPELGFYGVALATLVSYVFGFGFYLLRLFLLMREHGLALCVPKLGYAFYVLKKILFAGVYQAQYALGFLAGIWIVGRIGTVELAVYQLLTQGMLLPIYLCNAFTTLMISQCAAAQERGDYPEVRAVGLQLMRLCLAIVAGYSLLATLLYPSLLRLSLPEAANYAALVFAVSLAPMLFPLQSLSTLANALLQGMQAYERVWLVSTICQWLVYLPLAFLFALVFKFGLLAVLVVEGSYRLLQSAVQLLGWRARLRAGENGSGQVMIRGGEDRKASAA